jgi:hypothetical protein
MLNRTSWARAAALTASFAIITAALPAASTFAQQAPTQELEQARAGEDGSSGSGAGSGNTSTGNAGRDEDGNGGNASAGSAGEGVTDVADSTESPESSEAPLPENAELLDALGVLDDVTAYDLTILTGLDIPISLLPPPPVEPDSAAPDDINTGGQGTTSETAPADTSTGETAPTGEISSISTDSGTDAAPAGGSTGTAADDGVGAMEDGERVRERPRRDDAGATEAPGG